MTAASASFAAGSAVSWTTLSSPLGPLTLVGTPDGLSGLYLSEQRFSPRLAPAWRRNAEPFMEVAQQLEAYFAGERRAFDVSLAPAGTPFQRAVWQHLTAIGYGETLSYTALATRVGNGRAARAVAQAVGRNPLSIIVPCHRVLGAGGALTGYAGGVERKRWLLQHEADGVAGAAPTVLSRAGAAARG